PMITASTTAGSTPPRSSAPTIAAEPSCGPEKEASAPWSWPCGVRAAATTTISDMGCLPAVTTMSAVIVPHGRTPPGALPGPAPAQSAYTGEMVDPSLPALRLGPQQPGSGPSLAQIEALIAVTDPGSHAAAADVLQIAQPSLSRRIRSLEQALGARLLVAVGRRMELTEMGRGVVAAGRRALAEMGSIGALVGSARALASGALRVGGLPSLVATELPVHLG